MLRRTPAPDRSIIWLLVIQAALWLAGGRGLALAQPLPLDLHEVGTPPDIVTRIHGSTGHGRFGVPVAGGEDCDGDGLTDVAFAAMVANPLNRFAAGEVTLVFGNGTIGGQIDTAGLSPQFLKIAGSHPFETTGAEIWMDDVTGDGIGDLLMGRQNHSPTDDRPGAGALTILVGTPALRQHASTLAYLDLAAPPPPITLTTIVGANAYDRLGIWVRTGDVTGDGIADIVVSADEADRIQSTNPNMGPIEPNVGAVYLIRGGPHLATPQVVDLANLDASPLQGHVARLNPPPQATNYHLGATCQLADLDGNGRAEVLAAATLNRAGATRRLPGAPAGTGISVGGSPHGTLYIAWDDLFLGNPWPLNYTIDLTPSPLTTIIDGPAQHQNFGEEIIGGLDLDGDTWPELFIGDLTADGPNGSTAGRGYVFYQAHTLKGLEIDLDAPPEHIKLTLIEGPSAQSIGADTAVQGDFNADGLGDLVICNPHDSPQNRLSAGSLHILFGQLGGWPPVVNLAASQLPDPTLMQILPVYGARGTVDLDAGDTLCYSAASGDLNHDGIPDLLVNEMVGNGLSPTAIDVGNVLVISGTALVP